MPTQCRTDLRSYMQSILVSKEVSLVKKSFSAFSERNIHPSGGITPFSPFSPQTSRRRPTSRWAYRSLSQESPRNLRHSPCSRRKTLCRPPPPPPPLPHPSRVVAQRPAPSPVLCTFRPSFGKGFRLRSIRV